MFIEGRKGREGRTNTTIINDLRIVTSLTISHDVLWEYNCLFQFHFINSTKSQQ